MAASFAMSLYVAQLRVGSRVDMIGLKHFPAPPEGVIVAITLIYLLMAAVALGWLRWLNWRP